MKSIERAEFRRTLPYFWSLYLIVPAVACFALSYLMYAVHLPKDNEKVSVFVASRDLDASAFKKQMEASLKEKGAKAAETIFANPADVSFGNKLAVVGFHQADLFLIPESVLYSLEENEVLLPFSADLKDKWISLSSPYYLSIDGLDFGVRIHEKGVEDGLSPIIDYLAEDYYLCLNFSSKTLGGFGIYDIPEDDLSLEAFAYLQEASQS
ncbi:MAG: hypothetical protein J5736_03580 [Bacilli bacterium]|nr:hypothetical protein [Bacilli bacterium]